MQGDTWDHASFRPCQTQRWLFYRLLGGAQLDWQLYFLKTNTQTHCRPPRDSSASANKRRKDSCDWPGWWYYLKEPDRAVVCQKQSTKQKKIKKHLCSGSAGRSHFEHVIEMAVWHNPSEREVQSSCLHEGICKQHSGSHALVTMQQHCSLSFQQCIHSFVSDWVNINREPLYLLRQS